MDREVVSPVRRVSVGALQTAVRGRGESDVSSTDQTKTEQLGVTSHGCEGDPAIEGLPSGGPASLNPVHFAKTSLETRPEALDSDPMGQPIGQSTALSLSSAFEAE